MGVPCMRAVLRAERRARRRARPTLKANDFVSRFADFDFICFRRSSQASRLNYRIRPSHPPAVCKLSQNSSNLDQIVAKHRRGKHHVHLALRVRQYGVRPDPPKRASEKQFQFDSRSPSTAWAESGKSNRSTCSRTRSSVEFGQKQSASIHGGKCRF